MVQVKADGLDYDCRNLYLIKHTKKMILKWWGRTFCEVHNRKIRTISRCPRHKSRNLNPWMYALVNIKAEPF
jgi:hypothetical protein